MPKHAVEGVGALLATASCEIPGGGCVTTIDEDLVALSKLLFLRGDLLGRIADHDRAEQVANEAIALSPDTARAGKESR